MTRHWQTRHDNCLQTCLASIFDVEVDQAPDIFRIPGPPMVWTEKRWKAVARWSSRRSKKMSWIQAENWRKVRALEKSGCYYIATGPTASGEFHCVVMKNGRLVHDPEGAGLAGPPIHYIRFEDKSVFGRIIGFLFLAFLFAVAVGVLLDLSGD